MLCEQFVILFLLPLSFCSLVIYPDTPGATMSFKFQVFLTQSGQSGPPRESSVYMTSSDHRVNQSSSVQPGRSLSWTSFAFTGSPILVRVVNNLRQFKTCLVRPARYNITCQPVNAKECSFVVTANTTMMSVEFDVDQNGPDKDITDKLLIFADPPETQVPSRDDPSVLYFDVGTWDFEGQLTVPSHIKEVYLAPGSYIMGGFISDFNQSVKIYGRGIVDASKYVWHDSRFRWSMINMDAGNGHVMEGFTLVDSMQFFIRALSENNTISNVKTVGAWVYNNDGISLGYGGVLKDSFIHANDDSIKLYTSSITVERCVVWQAQNGAVFQFGWWPSRIIQDVRVDGVDVIHTDWCTFKGPSSQCHISDNDAVFDMAGNTTLLASSNLLFRDIRVEGFCPRVFNFALAADATGSFSNVSFVDWDIGSVPENNEALVNVIAGTARGSLDSWSFVNFVVGGCCVSDPGKANFAIDSKTTSNITFACT